MFFMVIKARIPWLQTVYTTIDDYFSTFSASFLL